MPFPSLYPPGMVNQSFRQNLFNPFGIPIPTPGVRPSVNGAGATGQVSSAVSSTSSSSSSNRHPSTFDGSSRKYDKNLALFSSKIYNIFVCFSVLVDCWTFNDQKNLI